MATLSSAGVKLCDVMPSSEPPQQPRWTSAEESALDLCRRAADEEERGAVFRTEVDESARVLFAFAQAALRWSKNSVWPVSRRQLLEVRQIQELAFAVVAARPGGRRRAKELQLEVSVGGPLTVCLGERLGPRPLPDLRDVLDLHGRYEEHLIPNIDWNTLGGGCGVIFADGVGLQRPAPPRKWCDDCRKASSSTRAERRISEILRLWGPRECTCGASFTPTRPNRVRCDGCLAGHRSAGHNRRIGQPSS